MTVLYYCVRLGYLLECWITREIPMRKVALSKNDGDLSTNYVFLIEGGGESDLRENLYKKGLT